MPPLNNRSTLLLPECQIEAALFLLRHHLVQRSEMNPVRVGRGLYGGYRHLIASPIALELELAGNRLAIVGIIVAFQPLPHRYAGHRHERYLSVPVAWLSEDTRVARVGRVFPVRGPGSPE